MLPTPVAIIADDITGAADTAAAFARPGMPVPVSLDGQPRQWESRAAFAVTTQSRACGPGEVYELVAASTRAVLEVGAPLVYKKVDSNLRGNVGTELAAVLDAMGRPVLFAPAFPARGRTTVDGVVLVDGVPVADTEMARDPEAPVRGSRIAELISSQRSDVPVIHCPLAAVRAGGDEISRRLTPDGVLVVDAEVDSDLEAIARAALSLRRAPVLAGSAGLAGAVARQLIGPRRPLSWPDERRGPALAVLASSSGSLLRQVHRAELEAGISVFALPCENLSWEDESIPELREAILRTTGELGAGTDTLVYAVGPLPDVERPVDLVVDHLAHLAFVAVKQTSPMGLLVGGGSTAHAVLAALGAKTVEVDDEPLPGIAAGLVAGGDFAGKPVVLKPGAAGDEEAVVELVSYLGRRGAALEESV